MTLSTGQVLEGRYRIVKLLGQGGFGAVYQAWDIRLSRPCALKENLDPSSEAERQFSKEAVILANLNHPNLPRVTDHFTVTGQGQYLVMDFVEGEDLQEMLKRQGPLGEREVVGWVAQVCDALAYLHGQPRPIIHRDVKPANIKIRPDGQPMLVDFGIAKVYDPVLRTTLGARAVTPGYSPPEQYGQGRTDARSDIYALGATLYALLTGQEPADSVESLIGTAVLVPPRQLNARISERVSQVVMRALASDPGHRFQTAAEFKAALVGRGRRVPARQPQGRRPRPAVAAAALQPAQSATPAVGAARPGAVPFPAARQAKPSTRPGRRRGATASTLSILTLVLGLASWVLACTYVGALAAPAALVMGVLVLTKYRKDATTSDRVMSIIGMVSAALLIIGICIYLVLMFGTTIVGSQ